jgi:transcription elongation regulator 1
VGSSSLREELFKSFRGKIASSSAPTEDPAAKRAREKKEREAASLREREAKVRDEQFKVTMDVNKSRAGAGKEEAERLFGSLLVDAVRDDVSPSHLLC